jgi:hypothetical protein
LAVATRGGAAFPFTKGGGVEVFTGSFLISMEYPGGAIRVTSWVETAPGFLLVGVSLGSGSLSQKALPTVFMSNGAVVETGIGIGKGAGGGGAKGARPPFLQEQSVSLLSGPPDFLGDSDMGNEENYIDKDVIVVIFMYFVKPFPNLKKLPCPDSGAHQELKRPIPPLILRTIPLGSRCFPASNRAWAATPGFSRAGRTPPPRPRPAFECALGPRRGRS